jgi:bifunctional UDP-N-acetylglucosamine pyrophosphorylase / glucosamine-1-phosphate N-acetyltransferase
MDKEVGVIVLAAGEGTRMRSSIPKVLHLAAGRALVAHVVDATSALEPNATVVVVPPESDPIADALTEAGLAGGIEYAHQQAAGGTGDAAKVGLEALAPELEAVLVVPGDSPLLRTETLRALVEIHFDRSAALTMLTARVGDPTGYGRVMRDADGTVERIVEEKDASNEERAVDEVGAGVYVFDPALLSTALGKVDRENASGEYYLTDVVHLAVADGRAVVAHRVQESEILGVNSRSQLAQVSGVLRRRAAERWMDEGVTIIDPDTTYIDSTVTIGKDAVINPFCFLEGNTRIGERATVGPNARVVDSEIGVDANVSFAVVVSSQVGEAASVGPFASLRPGTRLDRGARAGTFVETKNTTIGADSKANHLAYLGDAEIGKGVNVGAGTITCNWDGQEKHRTVIEDEAYIGSDTMLVAPTHIGRRAATGAGAVVKGDVPEDSLAVGVPARIIKGQGDKMGKGQGQPPDDDEGEE